MGQKLTFEAIDLGIGVGEPGLAFCQRGAELIDPRRRFQRVPVIEEHPEPRSVFELVARVAAVPAGRPSRIHHTGAVEAAEEGRLDVEHVRRLAHCNGWIVGIIKPVQAHATALPLLSPCYRSRMRSHPAPARIP
ncbi:hypothetical protein AD006_29355 (plasmid) [Pseudonocardia sp. EC080610-09]|nr:hypothetical protein AD006_29355 [Pseudonocardia sp. EC080610-09]ALL85660.1 hypothetical protein AD017_31900 [Pseudonocardia sp. EC080619-01]